VSGTLVNDDDLNRTLATDGSLAYE